MEGGERDLDREQDSESSSKVAALGWCVCVCVWGGGINAKIINPSMAVQAILA